AACGEGVVGGGEQRVLARRLELNVRPGLGRGAGLAGRDHKDPEGAPHGGLRRTAEARRLASLRGGSPPGYRASGPRASPPVAAKPRSDGSGDRSERESRAALGARGGGDVQGGRREEM